MYEELKSSGITAKTPENIMLGAGTIHKGLALTDGKWNFEESLIGATSGGSKVSIVPEFTQIEVDGALVKVKGLNPKTGETATMEVNFVEMTPELLKMATVGEVAVSTDYEGYTEITSKPRIEEGDYIENLAYIGKKIDYSVAFDTLLQQFIDPFVDLFQREMLGVAGNTGQHGSDGFKESCFITFILRNDAATK